MRNFISFLLLILAALPLQAKVDPLSGQSVIGKIETEFLGKEAVSQSYLSNMIPLSSGQPYTDAAVDEAIQVLYNTDHFDDVYAKKDQKKGIVDLTFVLTPRYRIHAVEIEGLKNRKKSRILRKIKSKKDGILSEYHVHEDKQVILNYYKKKGYTQASVEETITYNEARGTADILYTVDEGQRARIASILFKGNNSLTSKELRKLIQIENRGLIAIFKGRGNFEKHAFAEDIQRLKAFYQDHGFLDVEISEDTIEIERNAKGSYFITIGIIEGKCYKLHDVTFSGSKLFDNNELLETAKLKSGEPFSPEKAEKAADNIRMHYGELGYLDTRVETQRYIHEDDTVSAHLSIKEGTRNTVHSINIQGNTLTRSVVILREVRLQPGDIFDLKRVRASESALRQTGYFKEVHITPEMTGVEGKKNLRITVKENRSTQINIGGQVNTLDRLQATIQFIQPNFDIARPRTKFRGDGQKFRVGGSVGSRSYETFLNWEEPWLFDRRLALGTDLNQRANSYQKEIYSEKRRSATVYLRKRLFELVNGTISYQIENIDIHDVNKFAPSVIKEEEGIRSASKAALSLVRDTRNSWIRPTAGNRFEYFTQAAGGILGGSTEYWRNELRGIQYIPVHPYRKQTVSLLARGGSIMPLHEDGRVPFFDRYTLGGSTGLRGFRHRSVSPKVLERRNNKKNAPLVPFSVGGNTFGLASAEYMIDALDMLTVAVFYDIGFVSEDSWDFNPQSHSSNWGVGLLIPIMGSMLRLDFGFPIHGDEFLKKKKMHFEFSFGLQH